MKAKLLHDPLNIVVCGIGGQGNILASELLGSALVEKGYIVAMGENIWCFPARRFRYEPYPRH